MTGAALTRRGFLRGAGALAGLALAPVVAMAETLAATAFPGRFVNVRDHWRAGDRDWTPAFRRALDAAAPGGTVLVPAGEYNLMGALGSAHGWREAIGSSTQALGEAA